MLLYLVKLFKLCVEPLEKEEGERGGGKEEDEGRGNKRGRVGEERRTAEDCGGEGSKR